MSTLVTIDALMDANLLRPDELQIAEKESALTGITLEQALLNAGFVSASDLREIRGKQAGRATISLESKHPNAAVLNLVPAAIARRFGVLPLSFDAHKNIFYVAMEAAHNIIAIDAITAALPTNPRLEIKLASRVDILQAVDRCYGAEESIERLLLAMDAKSLSQQSSHDKPSLSCMQLVDELLAEAVREGASDMHFEPEPAYLRLRYRIDGVLRRMRRFHIEYWSALLVRIKVLSGMNIAESRAAQDGRFSQLVHGRKLDFRVSSFPSVNGEAVVVRLLDCHAQLIDLMQMGLSPNLVERLQAMVKKPAGLIVASGPTGSGKSTTLYAVLNQIRSESVNIVTMEDPVEFSLPMVRQCSIDSAVKLDFASGVRSILRQDPDIILVGETRDVDTAEMVLRAALTGHLVLTTLHCQTALACFARFADLGLKLSFLAGNLQALLSQRLVRKLCVHCKQPVTTPSYWQNYFSESDSLYQAVGCEWCAYTGYGGRQAVVELYEPSASVHNLLADGAGIGSILSQVNTEQHLSLMQVGMQFVRQGITSLEELNRVVDLDILER